MICIGVHYDFWLFKYSFYSVNVLYEITFLIMTITQLYFVVIKLMSYECMFHQTSRLSYPTTVTTQPIRRMRLAATTLYQYTRRRSDTASRLTLTPASLRAAITRPCPAGHPTTIQNVPRAPARYVCFQALSLLR